MTRRIIGWVAIGLASVVAAAILIVNIFSGNPKVEIPEEAENAITDDSGGATDDDSGDATEGESNDTSDNDSDDASVETELDDDEDSAPVWHFWNLDLQDDGNSKNDNDFGVTPMSAADLLEPIAEAVKANNYKGTINVSEILAKIDPYEVHAEFVDRLYEDPALGAASMAWVDSLLGTRHMGVFYSAAKEQWDVAINAAKDEWVDDQESYYAKLRPFLKQLDKAEKVEITRKDSGLTDQMYMDPLTESGIPDVIVMETADHSGWFLTYTFVIKETKTIEVSFRLDCGFQPCNVAKIMKITAKSNPNKPKTTGGGGGGGNVSGGGGVQQQPQQTTTISGGGTVTTTTKTTSGGGSNNSGGGSNNSGGGGDGGGKKHHEDPVITEPKAITDGAQVQPSDVSGPGEDTNNGVGAQYSTADQETNSNRMESVEEYHESIEELKEANEISREGGESNTPTYNPQEDSSRNDSSSGSDSSSNTITVDNNGDTGNADTGSAPIDTPTQESSSEEANDENNEVISMPPL